MPFKLGKLPARHTMRTMRSALAMASALGALGAPPASSNNYMAAVTNLPCDVYGNDTIGDCVEVDSAYATIIRTANAATATVIPSKDEVLALYRVFGFNPDPAQYSDPGTDELAMCQYLKNTGWLGRRLNDYATTDPSNIDHLKWCIQLFGGVRVGWQLPNFAIEQFDNSQPWDLHGGDQSIAGGHDTRLVHYEGDTFFTSTWGRWMQPVTRSFVTTFCEEAHPELALDWIAAQGIAPSGFSLDDLEKKLQEAAA